MQRLTFAIRAFFAILFSGSLPADIAKAYGYSPFKPQPVPKPASQPAPAPKTPQAPQIKPSDGALQMLSILQRDSRLIDFLMEDISPYSDDQVGAAVRNIHDQCRETLDRYIHLVPVIDGVEGTFTKIDGNSDPNVVKLLGNVPASGKAPGGLLRHKGWRADRIDLPQAPAKTISIISPAEVEVE